MHRYRWAVLHDSVGGTQGFLKDYRTVLQLIFVGSLYFAYDAFFFYCWHAPVFGDSTL